MVLNFLVDVNFFLCLEKPIVIKTIPNIPTKGCSTANCLAKDVNPPIPFSFITLNPRGDTKYNTRPISNCMCETINANRDILKSLA